MPDASKFPPKDKKKPNLEGIPPIWQQCHSQDFTHNVEEFHGIINVPTYFLFSSRHKNMVNSIQRFGDIDTLTVYETVIIIDSYRKRVGQS